VRCGGKILATKTKNGAAAKAPTGRNGNGNVETETKTASVNNKAITDTVDPDEAQTEYKHRKRHQLEIIKKTDKKLLLKMLYEMVLGRRFEEKCAEVYRVGEIGGFCHLYIGQEAVAVGSMMALRDDDLVITSYRDHVQAMVKGIPPEEVLAELYGKIGGVVKGKGGSMHMFDAARGFFGGHGIVGGQIGVGTGMAYATKYKGTDQVTICFFGEAAVNQGIFHESLNMAQLWKLPVIYICENNKYGMGTSQQRAMSISSVAKKAEGYGIANEFVDGMDVMAVREATQRAIERARNESLPTLLEIRCYRYMGHSMSDPGKYRSAEEIKKYRQRDPIELFRESLVEANVLSQKDYEGVDRRAREAVDKAVKFAEDSPFPPAQELLTDVFA
jgi:pyruvate dehydrogenase E1 component alpha subunit